MGSTYNDAHSLWQQGEKPLFNTLSRHLNVDTCIIGGGIAGLSIAYYLIKEGQSVAVLDRERLGLGESGLTSAHLSSAIDDSYAVLQRLHGHEGARLAAESHTHAIDCIEQIQADENIECEFKRVDGYLFLSPTDNLDKLMLELTAARASGITDVRMVPRAPLEFFESGPCLLFPRQGQFNPLKYLSGLAHAVQRQGGQIYTHTDVFELHGGHPATVKTTRGFNVECDNIVEATNVPINNKLAIHTKNAAYRSYMIGVAMPPNLSRDILLWDTAKPYHYVRFAKHPTTFEDLILIGGEDHRTGHEFNAENHFKQLERWTSERLGLNAQSLARWSGQVMEPIDGLAYIGRNPLDSENVYIVTGDSGHGITHATIAGMIIRDLILGRKNPWAQLYDPRRLNLRSLGEYLLETAASALPYGDWLADGDVRSLEDIKTGEGAVLRDGLRRLAIYKDELHRLHCFSPICTHLGGLVRWNSAEKTWDCPCHGSRYDRFGQVINGPAVKELTSVHEPHATQTQMLKGLQGEC